MNVLLDDTAIEPIAARVTRDSVIVDLQDGRTIITPIEWYPRLIRATAAERNNIELAALGLYWPDLDEDLSVEGMLKGRRSSESAASLERWLAHRARGEKVPVPHLPLSPKLEKELRRLGVSNLKGKQPAPTPRRKRVRVAR
jgi:hypothetical protein